MENSWKNSGPCARSRKRLEFPIEHASFGGAAATENNPKTPDQLCGRLCSLRGLEPVCRNGEPGIRQGDGDGRRNIAGTDDGSDWSRLSGLLPRVLASAGSLVSPSAGHGIRCSARRRGTKLKFRSKSKPWQAVEKRAPRPVDHGMGPVVHGRSNVVWARLQLKVMPNPKREALN